METNTLSETSVKNAISGRKLFPCFFGSALRNEGVDTFLHYIHKDLLSAGTYLKEVRLENVTFRGLNAPCPTLAPEDDPLHVYLKNVSVDFRENAANPAGLFDGKDPGTHIHTETL